MDIFEIKTIKLSKNDLREQIRGMGRGIQLNRAEIGELSSVGKEDTLDRPSTTDRDTIHDLRFRHY